MNDIISYTQSVFRSNFQYLIKLSAPFIILGFLPYFFPQANDQANSTRIIIGLFAYFTGFSMYQCSLVLFLSQEYQKNLAPVKNNLLTALIYTPLLLLTLIIIYSPFIAISLILFSLDFHPMTTPFLLIIGIYISLKSTFVPFHLILEGDRPLKAIKHSFSQTTGRVGKIIIILICFYAVSSMVDSLTSINTTLEMLNMMLFFIGIAVTILLVSVQQTAIFKLYLDSCFDRQKGSQNR